MTEGRDRLECAARSLQAGMAAFGEGRFEDAGALFRCAAKFCEGAADVGDWTDAGLSARGLAGYDARAVR